MNLRAAYDEMRRMRMINGDDRFRSTLLSAAEVEKYDREIQLIAQKSKQEMFIPGQKMDEMAVTYLKTALIMHNGSLLRVDSIAKIILGRYNRERPRLEPAPYSLVIETLMASSRTSEHPELWILVSWLYNTSPEARAWFDGKLSLEEINAGAVIEQMRELKRTRGKKWLVKKGVDPDYVIDRMAERYGFVSGGHRESDAYLETNEAGVKKFRLDKLPVVETLLAVRKNMSQQQLDAFKPIRLV